MSGRCDLAEPYRIHGFEGSLGEWLEHLEWQYRAIVGEAGIRLWGMPVRAEGGKAPDGRDRLFWHLVTSGTRDNRKLDLMRASLLPRVWDLLERLACGDPRACWWQEKEKHGRSTLHVASVDFGLHVVLRRAGGVFVLKTAHPAVKRKQRGLLMNRAARSWNSGCSRRDAFRHAAWRRPQVAPFVWPDPRHDGP